MLEQLQRKLKGFIRQSRSGELFALLDKCLRSDCTLYNDILLLAGSLSTAEQDFGRNLIEAKELRSVQDRVNYALLRFIDQIRLVDLSTFYQKKATRHSALSDYHAYTCDRVDQNGKVLEHYYLNPDSKVRHFFLYGDARQAHKSLFERFHRYFGGTLDNWEDPNAQPSVRVKVIECQPCRGSNALVYRIDLLKKILGQCRAEPNLQSKLLQCSLNDLVAHSDLQHFEPHDFVFVLLTVNDMIWTDEIPKVVDDLLKGFCNCQLSEHAPNFFFFYGIEYGANKPDVKKAVKKAVEDRANCIIELPELQRVRGDDVNEWFSRHPRLMPKNKNADEMSAWLFGDQTEFDMIEIQEKLLEIIQENRTGMNLDTE